MGDSYDGPVRRRRADRPVEQGWLPLIQNVSMESRFPVLKRPWSTGRLHVRAVSRGHVHSYISYWRACLNLGFKLNPTVPFDSSARTHAPCGGPGQPSIVRGLLWGDAGRARQARLLILGGPCLNPSPRPQVCHVRKLSERRWVIRRKRKSTCKSVGWPGTRDEARQTAALAGRWAYPYRFGRTARRLATGGRAAPSRLEATIGIWCSHFCLGRRLLGALGYPARSPKASRARRVPTASYILLPVLSSAKHTPSRATGSGRLYCCLYAQHVCACTRTCCVIEHKTVPWGNCE